MRPQVFVDRPVMAGLAQLPSLQDAPFRAQILQWVQSQTCTRLELAIVALCIYFRPPQWGTSNLYSCLSVSEERKLSSWTFLRKTLLVWDSSWFVESFFGLMPAFPWNFRHSA